jgi:hypothetical protein
MARSFTSLADRLWAKVERRGPDECWPWLGATNAGPNTRGGPYGKIGSGGKHGQVRSVHRAVHELEIGPIPEGFHVDHLCGFTLCCNPAHLQAVTAWENNRRSSSPTSANIVKTHCPQGHEYTVENTGYRKRDLYRYCRMCARLAQRAKRQRGLTYTQWLEEYRSCGDHLPAGTERQIPQVTR